jgi:hypothetical protein
MLEIVILVIAVGGIATLARGRGTSPYLAGGVAVAGYVVLEFGGAFVVPPGDGRLVLMVAGWAWVGLVALFVRFVIGAGKPKPDGKWSCANCNYLNNASSIVCEACQQPWKPRAEAIS